MTYVEGWFESLLRASPRSIPTAMRVTGQCDQHLGPRLRFARVTISVRPGDRFDVQIAIPPALQDTLQEHQYLDYFVFGFLDVMLTSAEQPATLLSLTITDVDYDPINSSQIAFRLAGRDAGRHVIAA